MAKIVKKLIGGYPEKVHVLNEAADFDHKGLAKVSDEVAATFEQIPGYVVLGEAAGKGMDVIEYEAAADPEVQVDGAPEVEVDDEPDTENTNDSEIEDTEVTASAEVLEEVTEADSASTQAVPAQKTKKAQPLKKAGPGKK